MKNFMGNLTSALPPSPASAFISGGGVRKPEGKKAANGSVALPSSGKDKDAEAKSARVQILMRPTLVARLKAVARSRRTSLNALINETMEKVK